MKTSEQTTDQQDLSALRHEADRMFHLKLIKGDRAKAAVIRRSLTAKLLRAVKRKPKYIDEYYLLLADIRLTKPSRLRYLNCALTHHPTNAETNADLGFWYASTKDVKRSVRHLMTALRYCKGHDVEDTILIEVEVAAQMVNRPDLVKAAVIGQERWRRRQKTTESKGR